MSWIEDGIEEFKKLPTWGKVTAGVVLLAVAGFAWYEHAHPSDTNKATAAAGSGMSALSGSGDVSGGISSPPVVSTSTGNSGTPASGSSASNTANPIMTTSGAGNPVAQIVKQSPTPTTPATPRTYTVQPGDNLSAIAAKLHLSGGWQSLYDANRSVIGSNPNLIYSGTVLKLP